MTDTIKQSLFLASRKMRLYSETGQAVPVSMMAERCACTEAEVIETWKWFIDSGHDKVEGYCFEFTNDYSGIVKKLSLEAYIQADYIYQQQLAEHSKKMRI